MNVHCNKLTLVLRLCLYEVMRPQTHTQYGEAIIKKKPPSQVSVKNMIFSLF